MIPSPRFSDPFGVFSSFEKIGRAWMSDPDSLGKMLSDLGADLQKANEETVKSWGPDGAMGNGAKSEEWKSVVLNAVKLNSQNARRYHRILSKWMNAYVEKAPDINEEDRQRSGFWAQQMLNSLMPSNCFWTNPMIVKRCLDTDGQSLKVGLRNWLLDQHNGDRLVKLTDPHAFKIGYNLAYTPGKVVYRNELMELIQYHPAKQTVFSQPVVLVQPWINKYYIFDLTEENSLVRYLAKQGFTVFITSWKNPDTAMKNVCFDDYMIQGALKAAEVAAEICNVRQVHAAGYCIGGTVLAALLAWLNRSPVRKSALPIAHWSVFSTLTDFSDPGELGVFINQDTINTIEQLMQGRGYLDKTYISYAFRLLRSQSLIWRYVVHTYLNGGDPPKSDMLFWNSDGTRLPEKMCSFYLREFYLANKMAKKDELILADRPVDLGRIGQPLYAVGAIQDHISPWESTFQTCNLVSGPVRYALSAEGHITGIVNPPAEHARKKLWIADVTDASRPQTWLESQKQRQGSWWPDWVSWLGNQCGPMTEPPSMGSEKYPVIGEAPGTYVLET